MENENYLNAMKTAEKMMANCFYPYPHGLCADVFYWYSRELADNITEEGRKAIRKMETLNKKETGIL